MLSGLKSKLNSEAYTTTTVPSSYLRLTPSQNDATTESYAVKDQ